MKQLRGTWLALTKIFKQFCQARFHHKVLQSCDELQKLEKNRFPAQLFFNYSITECYKKMTIRMHFMFIVAINQCHRTNCISLSMKMMNCKMHHARLQWMHSIKTKRSRHRASRFSNKSWRWSWKKQKESSVLSPSTIASDGMFYFECI